MLCLSVGLPVYLFIFPMLSPSPLPLLLSFLCWFVGSFFKSATCTKATTTKMINMFYALAFVLVYRVVQHDQMHSLLFTFESGACMWVNVCAKFVSFFRSKTWTNDTIVIITSAFFLLYLLEIYLIFLWQAWEWNGDE